MMNGLFVRVGADQSRGGGNWNGPVDSTTGEFAYVAIPENRPLHPGLEKPYAPLTPSLAKMGVQLPEGLRPRHMHLDPDFGYLTYGDQGERAKQLRAGMKEGDVIVFYAGLKCIRGPGQLVYAIIGLLVVDGFSLAREVAMAERDINAHSRRVLTPDAEDLIVHGRSGVSGRLARCLPIGEFRDRAYRVRRDLLDVWGGLSVKDGYLQRSARLPRLLDAPRFLAWFGSQTPTLLQTNNPE